MTPHCSLSKRPLSRSPNQAHHSASGHNRSPKRSKSVTAIDQRIHDPKIGPTLDPTSDPTLDPPSNPILDPADTDTDTLDLKLVSWLSKMSVKDPWLQKLLRKVGEGELSMSELEEYNRYIAQAQATIEARPQSPTEQSPMEGFHSARLKVEESRSKQFSSSKSPGQPTLERQMVPTTPAFSMPATQHLRSYPTLFFSPEPESDGAKNIERGQIADAAVNPFSQARHSINRSVILSEKSHTVYNEKSIDSAQAISLAGENTSILSTKPRQSSASSPVGRTASQKRSNIGRNGGVARSSGVIEDSALSSSICPIKHGAIDTFSLWIHQRKARTSNGQAEKRRAVYDPVEDKDEDAKFFAKYEKKKLTDHDLARYRQGQNLPLAQGSEAGSIQKTLVRQGVEMEENEPYERCVLEEKFGFTGPTVNCTMKTKFDTRRPSSKKLSSNTEQQKPRVSLAALEKYKLNVQKLRETISLKGEIISEKDATINKLCSEVKLLKRTQRPASELAHNLTKATEHQDDGEAEIRQLKAQLAAAKEALENAHGLVLEQKRHYEGRLQARELTDAEIEAANLRDENAALKKTLANLRSQNDPFAGHHFAHQNLFASPLMCASLPIRAPRSQGPAAPARRRGRLARDIQEVVSDEDSSVYGEETSSERERGETGDKAGEPAGEESAEEVCMTKNERGMMALNGWLAVPANPKPVRLEGLLGYRDGTKDARGRLPRAKKVYKVGRNVAGELR